jgi:hypothetical protein
MERARKIRSIKRPLDLTLSGQGKNLQFAVMADHNFSGEQQ